jgi:folate-dependent phosphoribosylglycinamide formyltransferase PurN
MFKLAVFVSGRGSNLKAVVSEIENGNLQAMVAAVVSNKDNCGAVEFAEGKNIPTYIVSKNPDGIKKLTLPPGLSEISQSLLPCRYP